MEAVTIISPPGGALNNRLARVSIRPEVHAAWGFRPRRGPSTMMVEVPVPVEVHVVRDEVIVDLVAVPKLTAEVDHALSRS